LHQQVDIPAGPQEQVNIPEGNRWFSF
jgi:hypothetical protein